MNRALILAATLAALLAAAPAAGASDEPLDVPAAPWIHDRVHDGIVYFLFSHPARLERFDLVNDTWLPTVVMPQTPSVFDVCDEGIFVGFRSGLVSRFDHFGGSEFPLIQLATEASSVTVIGEVLLVINNSLEDVYTFSTGAGGLIDFEDFSFYQMVALAPVPIFGRVIGNLESRPGYLELGPYGHLGGQERLYSSPSILAEAAWASPDSSFVVFDTGELWFANPFDPMPVDLGGTLDGLVFHGELPIVLREDRLIGYSRSFHRTGEVVPGFAVRRIYLHGDALAIFHLGLAGVEVSWIPVSDLGLPPAEQPVDPRGLAFAPADIEVDHRGIVYLLSTVYESVFRFSTSSGSYLETIPTNGRAMMIAYSPVDDRLFVGYESGKVGRVELAPDGEPSPEIDHVTLPLPMRGLTAVSEYLLTADGDSWTATLRTHDTSGALISIGGSEDLSSEYPWCGATRRFYRVDSYRLYHQTIDPNGVFGSESSSNSDYGIAAPIRISGDGSKVLLKYGDIYDADSLVPLDEIGASHLDAAWIGSGIVTVIDESGNSRLIAYADDLSVIADMIVPGAPLRLIPDGDGVVLVSENPSGRPVFSHWSADLVSTDLRVHVDDGLDQVAAGDPVTWSISVSSPASGSAAGLAVTSAPSVHLTNLSWTCAATPPSACGAPNGAGTLTDTATVDPAGTLDYTVTATVAPAAQGTARYTVRIDPASGPGWEDSDLTEVWDPLETFSDSFEDGTTGAWTRSAS